MPDKCPIEGPSDNWKNIPGNFSGIADLVLIGLIQNKYVIPI